MDTMALGKWGGCAAVMAAMIVALACSSGKSRRPRSRLAVPSVHWTRLIYRSWILWKACQPFGTSRIFRSPDPSPTSPSSMTASASSVNPPVRCITAPWWQSSPITCSTACSRVSSNLHRRRLNKPRGRSTVTTVPTTRCSSGRASNCLYLVKPPGGVWQAYIAPVGNNEKACLTRQRGKQLTVVPKKLMREEKDVPPVARWDYDTVNQRQYIGIKCGGEWCEIGHAGFETSAGHRPSILRDEPSGVVGPAPASSTEKDRVVLVKGWYDEQYLAEGTTGDLRPMHVRGTAFPHPMLDRLKNVSDFSVKWILSAYLLLDSDPGPYKSKPQP